MRLEVNGGGSGSGGDGSGSGGDGSGSGGDGSGSDISGGPLSEVVVNPGGGGGTSDPPPGGDYGGNPPPSGGGGETPSLTDSQIANSVPVLNGKPSIDVSKYLKCFENAQPGAVYTLTLYVDQPVYNSNDQWSLTPGTGDIYHTISGTNFEVGHAFVGFTANNPDGSSITQVLGFYPGSIGANIEGVIKDDGGHAYDVSYPANVSEVKFQTALNSLKSDDIIKDYVLSNANGTPEYNCTDAAKFWMVNAGVNLPADVSRGVFTNTPGDYGQALRQVSGSNTNAGYAPTSHGPCY